MASASELRGFHGVHRGVYGSLFDDPDYQELRPDARLTFLTVRLCAQAGPAAIFRYYPEVLARQTGLALKVVAVALAELARLPVPDSPWIVYDKAIIWVRNGLKYDPTIRPSNPKHAEAVKRAVAGLPHREIVLKFCEYYKLAKPFDRLLDRLPNASPELALRVPSTEVLPKTEILPSTEMKPNASASLANDLPDLRDQARAVLAFLNEKTGRAYRDTDVNLRLIEARLRDGSTVQDCKSVIAKKWREWGTDPKMTSYVRPATLFNATKFEQYRGEMGT